MLQLPPTPTPAEFRPLNEWVNRHGNVSQPIRGHYDLENRRQTDDVAGDFRAAATTMSMMIDAAAAQGVRLRALGGGWSLSTCAAADGYAVNTRPLRMRSRLPDRMVSTAYPGQPQDLLLVQCGTSIKQLNEDLATMGRALKTSGASNGQTLVGAMSTGTHGSRFGFGAIQDYCVALHVAVGGGRQLWLERSSYPVVSSAFINRIGATLVRDDAIFNAALVSMGAFGFIHAVVIETEPLYVLELIRGRYPLNAALRRCITSLDFDEIRLPRGGETPLHFEVVVNPHDLNGGAFVTTMYRRPGNTPYRRPDASTARYGPGDDILAAIGGLVDLLPAPVPLIVNQLAAQFYRVTPEPVWGTPGEIFTGIDVLSGGTSCEIGVALEDAAGALELTLGAAQDAGPLAGLIALRFVRGTRATLGFTRFPVTCTIELPCVDTAATHRVYAAIFDAFERFGVQYTLHWGQLGNYSPALVRRMYGDDAVDEWLRARSFVLDAPARAVFTNEFLVTCGLA